MYDVLKNWGFFYPPPPPLSEFYVLFIRIFGVFFTPSPSVWTSYMEAPLAILGLPILWQQGDDVERGANRIIFLTFQVKTSV